MWYVCTHSVLVPVLTWTGRPGQRSSLNGGKQTAWYPARQVVALGIGAGSEAYVLEGGVPPLVSHLLLPAADLSFWGYTAGV